MIEIIINKKKYQGIEKWSEMSCKVAADLFQIPLPTKLKEYYQATIDNKGVDEVLLSISEDELVKVFPTYYGKVISLLYNVPESVISKVKHADRTWIFDTYCRVFVLGITWNPNMERTYLEYVECDGEKLFLPVCKEVLGKEVPMSEETAMSFAEAADLQLAADKFQGGMFEIAPNLISVLCRPKGEKYDENKSLERAKKLQDIKMDVVWEVFFCYIEFSLMQNLRDLQSLLNEAMLNRSWRQKVLDYLRWDGMVQYWTYLKTIRALNMSKK